MRRSALYLSLMAILLATSVGAQEFGAVDKVTLQESFLTVGRSLPVRLSITNDHALKAYNFPLMTQSVENGYARFDSVRYVGRMANANVCNLKYGGATTIDGVAPDTIVTAGFLAGPSRLPLEPGDGVVMELFFTGIREGQLQLARTSIQPAGIFVLFPYTGSFSEQMYEPEFEGVTVQIRPASAGACGNVDASTDGSVDIADLTILIDYLFITLNVPAGIDVANVDASPDGSVDVGDLTLLIGYLFIGAVTPTCL